MKIYLTDQTKNFDRLLAGLIRTPVMTFEKSSLQEKNTTIDIHSDKGLQDVNLDFFFDYKIFPANILTFRAQWNAEKRKMQVGDTILQQVFIPPAPTFSQKIIFGVRINSIIEESARRGFSYETLEGHVEKGESSFTMEQSDAGLQFKIKTFSQPGNLLTKMLGRVFTVPYQAYCTDKALKNVKAQVEARLKMLR